MNKLQNFKDGQKLYSGNQKRMIKTAENLKNHQ